MTDQPTPRQKHTRDCPRLGGLGETDSQRITRLRRINADLLAALDDVLERLTDGRTSMDAASMAENADEIRAAIAKARGTPA